MRNINRFNNKITRNLEEQKSFFKIDLGKNWYKFSRNKISVLGLIIVIAITILAIFAPWIAPYPEHAGPKVDFNNAHKPPSLNYLCGTDTIGRDIFSRIIFAFRGALIMAFIVQGIAVPIGTTLGLIAGYFKNSWIDIIIMRITDVFLSVPSLILALAIAAVLEPNLTNSMLAISITWWPWNTRLVYGMASSIKNEYFVIAADLMGASKIHILVREILPNCLSIIFTKMTMDVSGVILVGAALSFVGLGEQPPTPALGQMISDGAGFLPTFWWISVFPAIAILIIVLGFNLTGDGVRDMLEQGMG